MAVNEQKKKREEQKGRFNSHSNATVAPKEGDAETRRQYEKQAMEYSM